MYYVAPTKSLVQKRKCSCKISWCPVNLFIINALFTLLPFPFMCLNRTRYRDGRVIAFVSETIRSFGQRGHCLLVFIFFR